MLGSKLDEVMEFPSNISWKVIGEAKDELKDKILEVLQRNTPGEYNLTAKEHGKWRSYSIPMRIENAQQMETLYKELSAIDIVRMVI